ncbi:caspase recruitment domain-containing protein 10 [Gadus morhua]|uniref:caspase recruitment domain-containing protein 10 n=1 Tax=Gadus morhua TaxID=8049 RepID=UPI0011B67A0A|nr:caspase recruitment domain-containing protein 10-like [Gadus morhua]
MLNPSIPDDSLGIRLQSIQDIVSQDKHCLLELSLANVQGLLKQGVYPIVIHIQPKNKKYGRLKYASLPQSPHANPDSNSDPKHIRTQCHR